MRRSPAILLALALASCAGGVTATTTVPPTTGSGGMTGSTPVATAPAPAHTSFWVTVKYRADPVDIAGPAFDYLDTSGSSVVGGAWYDAANHYMVIRLQGTYYHYCRMPPSAWAAFQAADSFGSHYNASIKGNYDCRAGGVPGY